MTEVTGDDNADLDQIVSSVAFRSARPIGLCPAYRGESLAELELGGTGVCRWNSGNTMSSPSRLHVSMLTGKGLDPRTIADRVGHAKPSFTLDRYSHFFESQRQKSTIDLHSLLTTPAATDELN